MKIKMRVKRVEWIEVELDEEDCVVDEDTLQAKFEFIENVKDDFIELAEEDSVARAEAHIEWSLEDFKVED